MAGRWTNPNGIGAINIAGKRSGNTITFKVNAKDSKTGETVPAHYITEVKAELNGKHVMTANWGPAVSKNPYLAFSVKPAKAGDTLKLSWVDNKGEADSTETTL